MAIVSDELEERLKQLEVEQDNQATILKDFGDFDKDIRKLEATLAQIDNYMIEQVDNSFERDELEETKKLERELQRMNEDDIVNRPAHRKSQPRTMDKKEDVTSLKSTANEKITKRQPKTTPPLNKNSATQSYVICLMFNPKSPQEWSGNGWCEYGKGMRYTTPEQVKQTFQKLKKLWPDYPLKIFKR